MSVPPALPFSFLFAVSMIVMPAFSAATIAAAATAAAATAPVPLSGPASPDTARAPVAAPLPPDSAMLRTTRTAIMGLNAGHLLTTASLWTIPGIYDAGILTMMGSKKTLKKEYVKRYHEQPMEFGQTGDNAYWQGWAMKGGAVVSLIVLMNMANEPAWGVFGLAGFAVLWLGGTFKHYEASRMLYEQSRHYENGILDENPPIPGQGAAAGRERFTFRYSTAF